MYIGRRWNKVNILFNIVYVEKKSISSLFYIIKETKRTNYSIYPPNIYDKYMYNFVISTFKHFFKQMYERMIYLKYNIFFLKKHDRKIECALSVTHTQKRHKTRQIADINDSLRMGKCNSAYHSILVTAFKMKHIDDPVVIRILTPGKNMTCRYFNTKLSCERNPCFLAKIKRLRSKKAANLCIH